MRVSSKQIQIMVTEKLFPPDFFTNFTYNFLETSIEHIVIFDFFGVPKDKKNQKCLMGLFDTSKDAH